MADIRDPERLTLGSLATVGTLKVARVEFVLTMLGMAVLDLWLYSCGLSNAELMVVEDVRADLRPLEVVRDSL